MLLTQNNQGKDQVAAGFALTFLVKENGIEKITNLEDFDIYDQTEYLGNVFQDNVFCEKTLPTIGIGKDLITKNWLSQYLGVPGKMKYLGS